MGLDGTNNGLAGWMGGWLLNRRWWDGRVAKVGMNIMNKQTSQKTSNNTIKRRLGNAKECFSLA